MSAWEKKERAEKVAAEKAAAEEALAEQNAEQALWQEARGSSTLFPILVQGVPGGKGWPAPCEGAHVSLYRYLPKGHHEPT